MSATDGAVVTMRTSHSVTFLLLYATIAVSLGCDASKKGTDEQLPKKVEPKVEAPTPPPPKAPWNEGAFQGKAQLEPASAEKEGKAKAGNGEPESTKAGEPLPLSLEVVLGTDTASGSGTARGEPLVVSGIADASFARLTIVGETVRGTFVGHGDEKAKTFKGTVRLSRTQTLEGKVNAEAYSGEFVLEPVVARGGD